MDGFNIYSSETPTREDITVIYTPPEDTIRYIYRVYNEDEVVSVHKINSNEPSTIILDSTGKMKIKVEVTNDIDTQVFESGIYIIDKVAPEIRVGDSVLKMTTRDKLNVMGNVKAQDNVDGNVTKRITSNISELDLSKEGKQNLIYTITDTAGNTTTKSVTLSISKDNMLMLTGIQVAIIIFLLFVIRTLLKYLQSIKFEKRYGKYAIEPEYDRTPSLFDVILRFYSNIVKSLGEVIEKVSFIERYSKRFEKYMLFTKDRYDRATDIIASKILCAFAFLILAVVSKAIQYKTLNLYEMFIPLVFGFFVIDVIYIFRYRMYRERIENDLLQGVIIMNNAFKSGRSIVQAIDLVGKELPGIIGTQFNIMKKELSKGLSVDVVFSRFASRVDIEEVNYLTASLTILNRTGGNIIKVFDSIQTSLFMKKKLRLELNSLTGSSKIIMWVLFLIPVLYVLIISVLNPTYFDPFFNTPLGIILLTVAIIFYFIYIIIVRKILKVRM